MMRSLPLAILALALAMPTVAFAQGDAVPDSGEPAETEPGTEPAKTDAPAAEEEAPVDALTARLRQLVERYYTGIGTTATEAEMTSAVASIQFMLLDGVGLRRIAAGVDQAIRLSTPGRRTPFEVAVPLRIVPADPNNGDAVEHPPAGEEITEEGPVSAPTEVHTPKIPDAAARTVDPETERRWEEAQQKLKEKRSRRRLYRQWRDRTREKRALLSLGIPLLATGYAIGFAGGGISVQLGQADHSQAWMTAIPVVGGIAFMASTQMSDPWPIGLSVLQGVGVGFVVAGFSLKIDWPHDRDPMAWTVPGRSGAPILTLKVRPTGAGGALIGTF